MSANSESDLEKKGTDSNNYNIHINASNDNLEERTSNTNTVQESTNLDSVVVHIEDTSDEQKNDSVHSTKGIVSNMHDLAHNNGKNKVDRDFIAYGFPLQNQTLPSTLVYFQTGGREMGSDGGEPLDYTPDRNAFVRLVFIIVFTMIVCTAISNMMVLISEPLSDIFRIYGMFFAVGAMILMIGLNYTMACSPCSRVFPCNIVCLVLAVIGMTIICCYVTVRYDTRIVLFAVMATAGVVFVCILLACSSFDFTKWTLYVVVIAASFGMVAMMVSLYMLISGNYIKILHLVILMVGTLLNVCILTIELQMILGGKTIEMNEDDYALGAYLLYTSIIDIFLKMVQILGIFDDM